MAGPFDYSGVGAAMPESYGADAPIMDPMAKALLAAMRKTAVPGQAYQSTIPVTTGEMVKPAADLAMMTTLGAGAAPAEADALRMGIKAYHGSPYDFEKFDISKIGTGEGAQAYGYGLYFAEAEPTAQSYRDALAPGYQRTLNGVPFESLPSDAHKTVAQWMASTGAKPAEVAAIADQRAAQTLKDAQADGSDLAMMVGEMTAKRHQDIANAAREIAKTPAELGSISRGRMYEVDINADPSHFLDWDRPLSEQSVPQELKDRVGDLLDRDARGITGADAIRALSQQADQMAATHQLREAGIPGIRYLDQGSRFQPQQVEHLQNQIAGLEDLLKQRPNDPSVMNALEGRKQELSALKPTSNYVVFNPDIINILRKYGIAGLPAAGVAADAMQPQPSPADMVNAIRGQ